MAEKRGKRKRSPEDQEKVDTPRTNEPWIGQRSGMRYMSLLSIVLAIFMIWQLWPSEGPLRSILWGLGFGAAIWAVFGFSLAFNTYVRRRRK